MRTEHTVTPPLNSSPKVSESRQFGRVADPHLSVRLSLSWGDSSGRRPLESDDQSRLEQNLFVTFNLAPTQMNLFPAPSSVIATEAANNMGARIVEYMN